MIYPVGTKWNQPTVTDVAALAGVSERTAFRVIANEYRGAEATRQKIETAIIELGYVGQRRGQFVTCSVPECGKPSPGSRVCSTHRERMRRTGTYEPAVRLPLEEAFWAQVEKDVECWKWVGPINQNGYGVFSYDNERRYAHRFAYELMVGQVQEKMQLDHVCHTRDPLCREGLSCRHRRCVNPDHLEPVTGRVNIKRAAERRQACRRGHPRVPGNVYVRLDGYQVCRACIRLRNEARAAGLELEPTRRTARAS